MKRGLTLSLTASTLALLLLVRLGCAAEWTVIDSSFLAEVPPAEPKNEEDASILSKATHAAAEASWNAFPEGEELFKAPFVAANKTTREVVLWCEATGMNPGEPTEFFIISSKSGHDYESILICYALPSAVHEALEFIGLKPGWPVNQTKLRFWPKGQRLTMELHLKKDGALHSHPIEHFVLDNETGQPIKEQGFVFTGSRMVEDPGEAGNMVYAADIYGPEALASDYNEAHALIELPRQGNKGEVYGQHICNPKWAMQSGHPIMVTLRPHPTLTEILHLDLQVSQTGYQLTTPAGKALHEEPSLATMLQTLKPLRPQEPFVTVHFADDLTIARVTQVAREIEQIEKVVGFRIDPPPEGQLYYKAFLPNPAFLDRKKRPTQPLEFHVKEGLAGELLVIEEKWGEAVDPEILIDRHEVPTPERFTQLVVEHGGKDPTLFMYVPSDTMTYGALQSFLAPHLMTFPVIYIYPQHPAP